MRALSSLAVGLSLVSTFLLLALVAELYYLLWWKKRTPNREIEEAEVDDKYSILFCWKQQPHPNDGQQQQQQQQQQEHEDHVFIPFGEEEDEGIEAELMRLHSLSGPPRFLFTIKEETKEDLESENGRSRKSSRGRSLSDVLLNSETTTTTSPFLTPLSSPPFFTPPLTPLDCHNPLFESVKGNDSTSYDDVIKSSSPPPKFKFLRDAEEKLYKKTLTDEAMKLHRMKNVGFDTPSKGCEDQGEGSFITIIIGKNREKGHHPSSSQVNPLPLHGKLGSYFGSNLS